MHFNEPASAPAPPSGQPWWKLLSRYHWFVFIVAALGWVFDCLDQQLFNLARVPAMRELVSNDPEVFNEYGSYATSIFLIGWASGGLFFGVLGDRIGRAKTMMLTILLYSLCTGLSAASQGFWDFAFYRFVTGLGVGGEFAVGVALVAEVMPERARPHALGLLQALSATGNISAALISIGLGHLEESGAIGSSWRWMFVIGTFPALLALVIRRRLKEPERWTSLSAGQKAQLGSYRELFSDPRWRRNALVGLALAFAGVVGLWGIGFFSIDLTRSVFGKSFVREALAEGEGDRDRAFVRALVGRGDRLKEVSDKVPTTGLIDADSQAIYSAMVHLQRESRTPSAEAILETLDRSETPLTRKAPKPGQSAEARERRRARLAEAAPDIDIKEQAERIAARSKAMSGRLTLWAGLTSMMLNIGAFFGIYMYSYLAHGLGRKPAFAICFLLAMASTIAVFALLEERSQVFWMIPLLGFCQLSLFGGYAVYFPELFPTRLRSTGTSFCYNVGRFVAAVGPSALGLLTTRVFAGYAEPMRYAGVTMSLVFVIGLLALPFAPETRGKPLPE